MNPDDLDLLVACFEARRRQQEMLPRIAAAMGLPEGQLFYAWTLGRGDLKVAKLFEAVEEIPNSSWRFNFHGFECDLRHTKDGRFIRFDFGPGGRCDCLTPYGILQFVMTSKPPWQEFPKLRERFAQTGPPYDWLSGDHNKVSEAWNRLEQEGCFEHADPRLVALRSRREETRRDGRTYLSYPKGTSDEMMMDCLVANCQVLTGHAESLLEQTDRRWPFTNN